MKMAIMNNYIAIPPIFFRNPTGLIRVPESNRREDQSNYQYGDLKRLIASLWGAEKSEISKTITF